MVFIVRCLKIIISFLVLLNSTGFAKEIICSRFIDVTWWHFERRLHTCRVYGQEINAPGIAFAPPRNLSVEAFDVKSSQKVQFIPENLSNRFPNLVLIRISGCAMKSVEKKHFQGLQQLIVLYLSSNVIEIIDSGAFEDNPKLEVLDLYNNSIRHLYHDLFDPLENLNELHLNSNKLQSIDSKTFINLAQLKVISLDDNQLEVIDEKMLKNNKNLEEIRLNDNKIVAISSEMFNSMKNLKIIDFEGNHCISETYQRNNFYAMKIELKKNCLIRNLIVENSEIES